MRLASGWSRAHTVVAATIGFVLVVGIGVAAALAAQDSGPPVPSAVISTATSASSPRPTNRRATPKLRPSDPLTGGAVSNNPVIAAKVENIAAARPQVGLHAADIVFAQEVEGGQTRLIAVFHTKFPRRLGPVRSARTTDAQLLPMFGKPGLVYSGANRRVQRKIKSASIVPITRTSRDSRRPAPHNVFVNLGAIAASTHAGKARPIGWNFLRDDERWAAADPARSARTRVGHDIFSFEYGGGGYLVRWNGRRYVDGDTGKITKTDNVVIMSVQNRPDGNRDVNGVPSVRSKTVGRGQVAIYRDGKKMTGSWQRASVSGPLQFRDEAGRDIALAPGKTWVSLHG
jgi:Protein of unknown function (DUF3048) N-terminal domain/Protein of unknown function (DUF3048) C-terminal domain